MSTYLWLILKRKRKDGNSYKIPIKDSLIIALLTLFFGSLFIYYLLDLPNVLSHRTNEYKGNCDIVIFDNIKGGGHGEANFGKHSITFPKNYQGIEEGNYYCEVEYYPRSELGKSLKLYKSNGNSK